MWPKKGKRQRGQSKEASSQGPLVRLGEAIVLDWTLRSNEMCFLGGGDAESPRGSPSWEHAELLPDEELQKKVAQRASRRKNGVTLDDCLDEFGKKEILSENNAWYCPKCKEFRRASKKFELWKAPDILIIHLKRFSASRGLRDKLDVMVDFPTEGLDLTSRVAMKDEGKSLIYDLIAVDNHYGGLGGGHYTAMARNFIDGEWYDYNGMLHRRTSLLPAPRNGPN
jgi:ubiquitin carboxyl-terminal hydrolase 4/11/15